MLRSKIYVLLKDSSNADELYGILKSNLSVKELDEVIEDSVYFIPFTEKRQSILMNSRTIEEIVDNRKTTLIPKLLNPSGKKYKKNPILLLPKQKKRSFQSQFSRKSFNLPNTQELIAKKEVNVINKMITRIDSRDFLMKTIPKRKLKNEHAGEVYKTFYDQYYKIDEIIRATLKK